MTSIDAAPGGVVLQNQAVLLNVSFIASIAFVPILVVLELGGDLFDFEAVPIPFLYVKLETFNRKSRHGHGRTGLTGPRLRSLVYAFGLVGLDKNGLINKTVDPIKCIISGCCSDVFYATQESIGVIKVPFGPQFNLLFLKDSASPVVLYSENSCFKSILMSLSQQTDKLMYFFNVFRSPKDLDLAANEMQVICPTCTAEWEANDVPVDPFGSQVSKFEDSSSFWSAIGQAAKEVTLEGQKYHWTFEFHGFSVGTHKLSCATIKQVVNLQRIYDFASVDQQFELSVFPFENQTASVEGCSEINQRALSRYGSRFHPKQWHDDLQLQVVNWKQLETFDEAFMFITDQQVTSKRYAPDLYLKAFDRESWIWIFVAGGISSIALAMLRKTSKLGHLMSGFWTSMRYLGAFFLDQCPSALPFSEAAVRSKKALLFVVIPWMMAILILSNEFRAVLQSNYSKNFPHETSLKNLTDFQNFDLFTFVRNENCGGDLVTRYMYETWIWWVVNGRKSEDWCFRIGPKSMSQMIYLSSSPKKAVFREHRIDEYMEMLTYSQNRLIELDTKNWAHITSQVWQYQKLTLVCVRNFSTYSGSQFHKNLDSWKQVALKGPAHMNISFERVQGSYKPCDSSINHTFRYGYVQGENIIKAFWMTRSHESAYVIRKSEFPWYWNLFKKAMVKDPQVQFAHTGGAEVTRKTKVAIYERNDSPFYLFVRHRYMEPADWMIKRIYAIQESGIFSLWYKWDMILRPPVNESLNEEVSETYDEVRELRLSDPGITFLVNVAAVLMMTAVAIFALEVTSMLA